MILRVCNHASKATLYTFACTHTIYKKSDHDWPCNICVYSCQATHARPPTSTLRPTRPRQAARARHASCAALCLGCIQRHAVHASCAERVSRTASCAPNRASCALARRPQPEPEPHASSRPRRATTRATRQVAYAASDFRRAGTPEVSRLCRQPPDWRT